jgi:hypothetical protein
MHHVTAYRNNLARKFVIFLIKIFISRMHNSKHGRGGRTKSSSKNGSASSGPVFRASRDRDRPSQVQTKPNSNEITQKMSHLNEKKDAELDYSDPEQVVRTTETTKVVKGLHFEKQTPMFLQRMLNGTQNQVRYSNIILIFTSLSVKINQSQQASLSGML